MLGTFSISLAVRDIEQSKQFYLALGFDVIHGEQSQNWLILRNGSAVIGLFQDMFDTNLMTFNPGWDQNGTETESFTDVRLIQQQLEQQGIEIIDKVQSESGPAHITLKDPDGNVILIDQHR